MTRQERIKASLLDLIADMDANLLQRLTDYANGLLEGATIKEDDGWAPTKEEIEGIKVALKQSEEGNVISSEEAKKRLGKWLE